MKENITVITTEPAIKKKSGIKDSRLSCHGD